MKSKIKELCRKIIKITPIYKHFYNTLDKPLTDKELEQAVRQAIYNVPFYKDYSKYLTGSFSIKNFPILRKSDIMGRENEFLSRKACTLFMQKVETGGSTGMSLELYYTLKTLLKKDAASQKVFDVIGRDLRVAVLRGNRPSNGKIYEYMNKKRIILSSYLLTEENIDTYIDLLKKYHITCLHVYPSSLSIFLRLIKAKYGSISLPELNGIFASSEIFSKEDKALIKEVLGDIKVIDFYSQRELTTAAYSINDGYYYFFDRYGFVEFIPTGEYVNGNAIAEIVTTSVMYEDMPFIRYGTDDYVELDTSGNVLSIIGRTTDFVVTLDKKLAPCLFNTRSTSMKNVIKFQYYQPEVGRLVYRVVVNDSFADIDKQYILEDMQNSFNDRLICEVCIVDDIERTSIGKQKRMVQTLNINNYK